MKKNITAWIAAIMLFVALIPTAALAAEAPGSAAVLQPAKVIRGNESVPKVSGEVTDSDPILFNGYRGKLYEIPFTESGIIGVTIGNVKGNGELAFVYGQKKDYSDKWEYPLRIQNEEQNALIGTGNPGDRCYLVVYGKSNSFHISFDLKVRLYPSADRTLKLSTREYFGLSPAGKLPLFKFTAKESGTIKVSLFLDENDATISLLNSKKQQISKNSTVMYDANVPRYFGVQKGKTYYLKLKPSGHDFDTQPFWVNVKNTKIKEKSGTTRKKAVTVKRNKKVKGYVLSGKKGHDWYKIKVKKSGKVKFYLQNQMTGQCYLDIYNNKGKKVKGLKAKSVENDAYIPSKTKYGRLYKGTYYVKVYTKDKRESGGYSLKWK